MSTMTRAAAVAAGTNAILDYAQKLDVDGDEWVSSQELAPVVLTMIEKGLGFGDVFSNNADRLTAAFMSVTQRPEAHAAKDGEAIHLPRLAPAVVAHLEDTLQQLEAAVAAGESSTALWALAELPAATKPYVTAL